MDEPITPPQMIQDNPHALETWNQLLEVSAELGLQPGLHQGLMVCYCMAVDDLRRVCMDLPQAKPLYTKAGGKVILSPRLMALERLAREVMLISQSLGINPLLE